MNKLTRASLSAMAGATVLISAFAGFPARSLAASTDMNVNTFTCTNVASSSSTCTFAGTIDTTTLNGVSLTAGPGVTFLTGVTQMNSGAGTMDVEPVYNADGTLAHDANGNTLYTVNFAINAAYAATHTAPYDISGSVSAVVDAYNYQGPYEIVLNGVSYKIPDAGQYCDAACKAQAPTTSSKLIYSTTDSVTGLTTIGSQMFLDPADTQTYMDEATAAGMPITIPISDTSSSNLKDCWGELQQVTDGNYTTIVSHVDADATNTVNMSVTLDPNNLPAAGTWYMAIYTCTPVDSTVDQTYSDNATFGFATGSASKFVQANSANGSGNNGSGQVGNKVWYDTTDSGVQSSDFSDKGVAGVTINITNSDGTPVTGVDGTAITSLTTDANGNYDFSNLPLGKTYTVTVDQSTIPAGWTLDTPNVGTDTTLDSGTPAQTSFTLTTTNPSDMTLDWGIHQIPSGDVGNKVWYDTNNTGVQSSDFSDKGVAGVTINITNSDGTPVTGVDGKTITSLTTDANGEYDFSDLPLDKTYTVTVDQSTLPTGWVLDTPNVGSNTAVDSGKPSQTSFTLTTTNPSDTTLDWGIHPAVAPVTPSGEVGNKVWYDTNNTGVQSSNFSDKGVAGVKINITNSDGTPVTGTDGKVITSLTTDANGVYDFSKLPLGKTYIVTIDQSTLPTGWVLDTPNVGSNTALDSGKPAQMSLTLTTAAPTDFTLDWGIHPATKPVVKPTTKVVTFTVQDDKTNLIGAAQVKAMKNVLDFGTYTFREDVVWNATTGKVLSAPLWVKGVSTPTTKTMSVTVPVNATKTQIRAAEYAAAAKYFGVTTGTRTPTVKHTYNSLWLVKDAYLNAWTNTTSWKVGPKMSAQVLIGTAQK